MVAMVVLCGISTRLLIHLVGSDLVGGLRRAGNRLVAAPIGW
jgi:hypothetical protein